MKLRTIITLFCATLTALLQSVEQLEWHPPLARISPDAVAAVTHDILAASTQRSPASTPEKAPRADALTWSYGEKIYKELHDRWRLYRAHPSRKSIYAPRPIHISFVASPWGSIEQYLVIKSSGSDQFDALVRHFIHTEGVALPPRPAILKNTRLSLSYRCS